MQSTNLSNKPLRGSKKKPAHQVVKGKISHPRVIKLWGISLAIVVLNLCFIVAIEMVDTNLSKNFSSFVRANRLIIQKTMVINDNSALIEKYSFTLNSMYLQRYLHQFQTTLEMGSILETEENDKVFVNLLENIDTMNHDLRNQEIHALKLLFAAYHIPNEVILKVIDEYQLSDKEVQMSDAEKLQLSNDLLFSAERSKMIGALQKELTSLGTESDAKWTAKIETEQKRMSVLLLLLFLVNCLLFIFIGSIMWRRYTVK